MSTRWDGAGSCSALRSCRTGEDSSAAQSFESSAKASTSKQLSEIATKQEKVSSGLKPLIQTTLRRSWSSEHLKKRRHDVLRIAGFAPRGWNPEQVSKC